MVRIGEGTWVGSGAIVLADVGKHCVIARRGRRHQAAAGLRDRRRRAGARHPEPPAGRRRVMKILFLTHRLPYAPNRGDRIRAYYLMREMASSRPVSLFSLIHDDEEASRLGHVPFASRRDERQGDTASGTSCRRPRLTSRAASH